MADNPTKPHSGVFILVLLACSLTSCAFSVPLWLGDCGATVSSDAALRACTEAKGQEIALYLILFWTLFGAVFIARRRRKYMHRTLLALAIVPVAASLALGHWYANQYTSLDNATRLE